MALIQCKCGSTFFEKKHVEQFAAGGYGTAEARSVSNAPKTILVCLCGRPMAPKPSYFARGTTAAKAEDDFTKSVELALKAVDELTMEHIAQIAVSPKELASVTEAVEEVRAGLLTLANKPKPKKGKDAGATVQRSSS